MSELPGQWIDVPLSEVTDINPPHPDRPIEDDQLVSFVPMALVTEESGTLDASQLRPWREVSKGYTRFQEGDVLFAKITPCMENGKFALASGLNDGVGAGSTEFHVLRPRTEIRSGYLLSFLFQSDVRRAARMEMKGAAGQLRVPTSFLERLRFPVAPPEEQDRIVAEIEKQFTRLDAATSALKRVQANLKRYRASVLKAACEGRLVPTEAELARKEGRDYEPADKLLERILRERRARWEADTLAKMIASGKPPKDDSWKRKYKEPAKGPANLPQLPDGWAWATVEQLTTARNGMVTGPFGTLIGKTDQRQTGIPVVGIPNITSSGFIPGNWFFLDDSKADELERYELGEGDIVISRSGTVGEACVIEQTDSRLMMSTNLMRLRSESGIRISRWLVLNFKGSGMIAAQLEELCKGSTRPFLNLTILAGLRVALPPEPEQDRILTELSRLEAGFNHLRFIVRQQDRRANNMRRSTLKAAFEGKLVPQDPNDEPASALLERIRAERTVAANGKPSKRSKKEPAYA